MIWLLAAAGFATDTVDEEPIRHPLASWVSLHGSIEGEQERVDFWRTLNVYDRTWDDGTGPHYSSGAEVAEVQYVGEIDSPPATDRGLPRLDPDVAGWVYGYFTGPADPVHVVVVPYRRDWDGADTLPIQIEKAILGGQVRTPTDLAAFKQAAWDARVATTERAAAALEMSIKAAGGDIVAVRPLSGIIEVNLLAGAIAGVAANPDVFSIETPRTQHDESGYDTVAHPILRPRNFGTLPTALTRRDGRRVRT